MLVTIAPMIAKNKLRDLCRGAIFLLKKKFFPSQGVQMVLSFQTENI
jgi:hypothetical protein